jgi:hypothetical protein
VTERYATGVRTAVRRAVPYTVLPLALIACALASSPWLRAFPADVIGVPLFGAAVLSVLAPLIVVGIGIRPLWQSALVDLVLFVFFELVVTLRAPGGFDDLYSGLVHGPSQLLTFALPLVSPRTLLVAPVALCWLSGAIVGECVARGWQSVLPYLTLLVTFGLSYAGTARAISNASDGRRYDTLLAGALLLALLLLRAAQAWVVQDESAEITQPEGVLPLRGLWIGAALSIVVAAAAAGVVQSSAFTGRPVTPARVPPLDQGKPLTPVAFVSSLRPNDPKSAGRPLFKFSTDRPTTGYVSLASVDFYDGDGWTFTRTFRPSGGVLPADLDPTMRPHTAPVTQQYQIDQGAMTTAPWMPYLYRAQRVIGTTVNIDPASGMIVPAHTLHAGATYTVRSLVADKTLDDLPRTALLGASAAQVDTTLVNGLSAPLGTLVTSLAQETGTPSDQALPFLQAVARDFRTRSSLAGSTGSPRPTPSATPTTSGRSGGHFVAPLAAPTSRAKPKGTTRRTPTPTPSPTASAHTGGTTFADVLASIRVSHSATPEQYATLTALVARELGVPARVATGFRVPPPSGSRTLPAGTYTVTTGDAWTWVEVPVRGLGWVVLDPSPSTYANKPQPPNTGTTPSQTPTPTPSRNAQLNQTSNGGHAVAPKSRTPQAKGLSGTSVLAIVLIAIAVLVLLLVAILLTRKRLRVRRRKRSGDPRRRLLGAWQESLDVLIECGLPELATLTSAEVSERTGARFGGEPAAQARYIGDAANVAIFSPTSWVGPAQADAAWQAQAVLARSVRARLGWRERVNAGLRYHRPRRFTVHEGPTSWADEIKRRAAAARRSKPAHRRR